MGRWRASGELAAQCPTQPCAYPGALKRIAGGKTTVPMVVAGTHCAPFYRLRTPPRKPLCRIHAACARLGEANFGCARPRPGRRPLKSGIHGNDLEHNVMAMRRNGMSPFWQENLGLHPEELHRTA